MNPKRNKYLLKNRWTAAAQGRESRRYMLLKKLRCQIVKLKTQWRANGTLYGKERFSETFDNS